MKISGVVAAVFSVGVLAGMFTATSLERMVNESTFGVPRVEVEKQIAECEARLPRDEHCQVATAVIPDQIAEELKRELRRLETYRAERTSDAAI